MQFLSTVFLAGLLASSAVAAPHQRYYPRQAPGKPNGNGTPAQPAAPATTSGTSSSGGDSNQQFPGLDAAQSKNAAAIISVAKEMNLGRAGCMAGIVTALQESTLKNYANPVVPESMSKPHDIEGGDQDSVGLFQQRKAFYPDVATSMDPKGAAKQFYQKMQGISGWQTMETSALCQQVQAAEAGNLYGQRIGPASQVCDAAGMKQ